MHKHGSWERYRDLLSSMIPRKWPKSDFWVKAVEMEYIYHMEYIYQTIACDHNEDIYQVIGIKENQNTERK